MSRRRYPVRGRPPHQGALTADLAWLLLYGWGTRPDDDVLGFVDDGDSFAVFDMSDEDFAAAWKHHRAALMKEWHRRGKTGEPWGASQFDTPKGTTG